MRKRKLTVMLSDEEMQLAKGNAARTGSTVASDVRQWIRRRAANVVKVRETLGYGPLADAAIELSDE